MRTLELSAVIAVLASAQLGRAQEPEPTEEALAEARDLFQRGLVHAEAREFAQAEQRFRDALAIRDAPAVRYNLGSALFEQGRLVEAYRELFRVSLDETAPADVRSRAQSVEASIRRRIAFIRVDLGGEADGATIDEVALSMEELGHPIPVAPGEHEVVGMHGERVVTRRQLRLDAGAQAFVDVSVIPTASEVAERAPAEPATTDAAAAADVAPRRPSRVALYAGIGAGAAVLLTLIIVLAVAAGGTEEPVNGDFEPGVIRW